LAANGKNLLSHLRRLDQIITVSIVLMLIGRNHAFVR